jgi:rubrerythrin
LCLVFPARWLLLRRRDHRRRADARCIACGYDLRGSPNRCPECGAVPEPPAAAA